MTNQQRLDDLKKQIKIFLNLNNDTDSREITQQYHIIYESLPGGKDVDEFYWALRGNPDYVALRDNDLQGDRKMETLARLKDIMEKLRTAIDAAPQVDQE